VAVDSGKQFLEISSRSSTGEFPDPACAGVASNVAAFCTITALADANGNTVLRNARPGETREPGVANYRGSRPVDVWTQTCRKAFVWLNPKN